MKAIAIKAFLIVMCFVGIESQAQVSITKHKQRYEHPIENFFEFVYDTQSKSYAINIHSDNEFEDKTVWISLGTEKKAIKSLKDMLSLFDEGGEYTISGYRCFVHSDHGYIYFYNSGKISYTAGSYTLGILHIKRYLNWLEDKQQKQGNSQ